MTYPWDMRCAALVVFVACWTGPVDTTPAPSEPAPPPRPHRELEIQLQRTACFGMCPTYSVTIRRDGTVEWIGTANVVVPGPRTGRIDRAGLDAIDRKIDEARFFARDPFGHIPKEPVCVHTGNTTSCSFTSSTFCTDTSHTTLKIRRSGRSNTTDNAHCSDEDPELVELEDLIVERAGVAPWIGR